MNVPAAVLKFCSVELARVVAASFGSTVETSMTLGLSTSRKLSEQAEALTTKPVTISVRETARRMVRMTVLGGQKVKFNRRRARFGCGSEKKSWRSKVPFWA